MSDSKQRRRGIQTQLDQLDPPSWITEVRRYFAEHGTLRPDHVAKLRGQQSSTVGMLSRTEGSMATLLQKMARTPRK
jgi:hypothetical protein